jgi:ribose transport system permease protein
VATLGTLTIFGGLALRISGGTTIFGRAIPEAFSTFGNDGILLGAIGGREVDLPYLTILALVVLVVVWVVLEQTVFGRRLYAIGGNKSCAAGWRARAFRSPDGVRRERAGRRSPERCSPAAWHRQPYAVTVDAAAIAAVFLGMTMSGGRPHALGTLVVC